MAGSDRVNAFWQVRRSEEEVTNQGTKHRPLK